MLVIPRPCQGCRRSTRRGRYCAECAPIYERSRHNRAYDDRAERRRRANAVAAHVARAGWWCPGYGRPRHPSRDLTADHPVALAKGGANDQELEVLCRSCNGRKGAR